MFIEERHQAILDLLKLKGSITTTEIQERFRVGYDSAKRDLRILEEKGLLRRTHGGAIPLDSIAPDGKPPRAVTEEPHTLAIADYARSLIKENETVFLTSDTVGFYLVRNLPERFPIRIVTNSLPLAELLRRHESVDLLLIGGKPDQNGNCCDGMAIEMLRRLKFHKAFLSADGLSADFGLSVEKTETVPFLSGVISASKQVIGLFPGDRLGRECTASVCPAEKLSAVVTDQRADPSSVNELRKAGIRLILVDEADESEGKEEKEIANFF